MLAIDLGVCAPYAPRQLMEIPETLFARSGDLYIAYQRFGTGQDVVVIPPLVSNIELSWEQEIFRRVLEHGARYVRVLQFDKRGTGCSDRFDRYPTLEERIGDINAVMDAEGIERASIVGLAEGGLMAQLFAAMHPKRVDRLVLINSMIGLSAVDTLSAYGRAGDPDHSVERIPPPPLAHCGNVGPRAGGDGRQLLPQPKR